MIGRRRRGRVLIGGRHCRRRRGRGGGRQSAAGQSRSGRGHVGGVGSSDCQCLAGGVQYWAERGINKEDNGIEKEKGRTGQKSLK